MTRLLFLRFISVASNSSSYFSYCWVVYHELINTSQLVHSSVKNYLGCFQFWAGVIKAARNIHSLLVDMYVFISSELLDQMVSVYFNCIKLYIILLYILQQFGSTCSHFGSICSTSLPAFAFCWFVNNFCHSNRCEVLLLRFSFAFSWWLMVVSFHVVLYSFGLFYWIVKIFYIFSQNFSFLMIFLKIRSV